MVAVAVAVAVAVVAVEEVAVVASPRRHQLEEAAVLGARALRLGAVRVVVEEVVRGVDDEDRVVGRLDRVAVDRRDRLGDRPLDVPVEWGILWVV